MPEMKIGELAEHADVSVQATRYYGGRGLILEPSRTRPLTRGDTRIESGVRPRAGLHPGRGGVAAAHCDSLDGPVVTAARHAWGALRGSKHDSKVARS
jgi:hypothetical protein